MRGVKLDNDPMTPKALNDLARHQAITRLEADILQDMMVCDIEGWDKTEFIRMVAEVVNHFADGLKGGDNEQNCI